MENNIKAWLIADTHFGVKGDDDDWLNNYIEYFENVLIPKMKAEVGKNDILIHCGDVFDNRSSLGLNTISAVVSLFSKLSDIFNDIRIITGNHDMYKKNDNLITSLDTIRNIKHIKIYQKPTVEIIDGKTCLFNPWIEDLEIQKKVLEDNDVDYFFGHIQVGGSKTVDRSGVHVTITGGVNVSDFKSAQVYAGHIHIKQDKKNIHYIGNPYHKDRGDIGNKKGILILDIKSGETKFIENTVSSKYVKDNIYDILNLTVGDLKKRWNNNYVELHIKGTDVIKCNFDDLRNCLNTYYKSFNTIGDNIIIELETNGEISLDDAKGSNDYIDDFIEQQDISDDFRESVKNKLQMYSDRK